MIGNAADRRGKEHQMSRSKWQKKCLCKGEALVKSIEGPIGSMNAKET